MNTQCMMNSVRRIIPLMIGDLATTCHINIKRELRPSAKYVMEYLGNNLKIAEIGVLLGENADAMLRNMSISQIFLIDPYREYFVESTEKTYNPFLEKFVSKFVLRRYKSKVIWIYKPSIDAVSDLPDLDYVYIDGDHSFQGVIQDIYKYYPKVISGGVLGGHDYFQNHNGTVMAVDLFARENNLHVYNEFGDWWLVK